MWITLFTTPLCSTGLSFSQSSGEPEPTKYFKSYPCCQSLVATPASPLHADKESQPLPSVSTQTFRRGRLQRSSSLLLQFILNFPHSLLIIFSYCKVSILCVQLKFIFLSKATKHSMSETRMLNINLKRRKVLNSQNHNKISWSLQWC